MLATLTPIRASMTHTDTYYFDWAHGKVDVLRNDEAEVVTYPSLDALVDTIPRPSLIIGEATFESFWRETNRNDFIRRCQREGHDLRTVPNRATGRWKLKKYPPEDYPEYYRQNAKFPDDFAVDLIRSIHRDGVHLKKPRIFDPNDPKIEQREVANRELMILRNTKQYKIGKRGQRLKTMESAKDRFANELISFLPRYRDLLWVRQVALGNGKEYAKVIVAAVGVATKHSKTKQEFDWLSGLFHHGYPSQIRSDLHLHGWWRPGKRELITLRDYRRELRWLYHQLKHVL